MVRRETGSFPTVTVRSSWSAMRPDGSTALVLDTLEQGPIAFAVDQRAIDALRRELTECEKNLQAPKGSA